MDTLRRCIVQPVPNGARVLAAKDVLRRLVVGLHKEGRVDDLRGQALRELIEVGSSECNELANAYLVSDKSHEAAAKLADGVLSVLDAQDELLSDKMRDFVRGNIDDTTVVSKLLGLISARDERVLEAFESFYQVMANGGSQEEGQEVLKGDLESLARGVELFGVDAELVDEDYELGDDEDDDADDSGLNMLFQFIKEWGLSDAELATLRAKILANSPDTAKALDAFANSQDPEAFRVAMTRAAKA